MKTDGVTWMCLTGPCGCSWAALMFPAEAALWTKPSARCAWGRLYSTPATAAARRCTSPRNTPRSTWRRNCADLPWDELDELSSISIFERKRKHDSEDTRSHRPPQRWSGPAGFLRHLDSAGWSGSVHPPAVRPSAPPDRCSGPHTSRATAADRDAGKWSGSALLYSL